ncbi:MAG: hypothetical protein LUC37_05310 [Prevotella sp.]|nr:hypothetical protein [Prevotella sp.]
MQWNKKILGATIKEMKNPSWQNIDDIHHHLADGILLQLVIGERCKILDKQTQEVFDRWKSRLVYTQGELRVYSGFPKTDIVEILQDFAEAVKKSISADKKSWDKNYCKEVLGFIDNWKSLHGENVELWRLSFIIGRLIILDTTTKLTPDYKNAIDKVEFDNGISLNHVEIPNIEDKKASLLFTMFFVAKEHWYKKFIQKLRKGFKVEVLTTGFKSDHVAKAFFDTLKDYFRCVDGGMSYIRKENQYLCQALIDDPNVKMWFDRPNEKKDKERIDKFKERFAKLITKELKGVTERYTNQIKPIG